jgi:hypothetical protein
VRIKRRQKLKTNTVVVIDQQMLKSKAWLSLGGVAPQLYLLFRTKCQIVYGFGESGGRERVIANNGQIEFTYIEANEKYGLTQPRFTRGLDLLIKRGFIDIANSEGGLHKSKTLYAISERWRLYRTPDFVPAERPKSDTHMGFQGRRKRFSTNENVGGHANENVGGQPDPDDTPHTKTYAAKICENAISVVSVKD